MMRKNYMITSSAQCLKYSPYCNSRMKSNLKIPKTSLKDWCCKTRLVISLYGQVKGRKESTVPFSLSTTTIKQESRKRFSEVVIIFLFRAIPLSPSIIPLESSKGYIQCFCR